ncbi:high light inducible protein [Synechococcus sp. BIOS-U3-1]|uniref:chlorophyll a/b-binding protein n=1 Tax=Synechococcus sp. BIOS-U3-1 TaxID=1400865 RepID=UPI000C6A1BC8|nr:chlorophyll a/b-binding protein [Synechococcus sp. BIOS-U3-1]MAD68093.1 high light inducible protein [Synechococcus sp. CPC100]QNI60222.1 high light inducible protein [Synechococcus sp. BIOS-U3-1]|tara:strand:+ start:127 stop:312 length:186 start_codon:yes stop_codon:yes gene_type:complete
MTTATLLADERYWQSLAAAQMRRERLAKAERLNGRLAMLGFIALITSETLLHQGLLVALRL